MFFDTDADSTSGTGRMIVDPAKLTQLKKGIDEERDRVREWLFNNLDQMTYIDPPGNDPCSRDAMDVMGQSGQSAIDKCQLYVGRLAQVADKLQESSAAYELTEDHNATAFRRGQR